jgi:hypothetical protein
LDPVRACITHRQGVVYITSNYSSRQI